MTAHPLSGRRCSAPGCSRIPEPKDDLCIVCQLGIYVPGEPIPEPAPIISREAVDQQPAEVLPWQIRVGREGALTGRVPVVKGRLVQAWAPRIARGLGDF